MAILVPDRDVRYRVIWAQMQKVTKNRILYEAPERKLRYLVMLLFVRAKSVSPYRIQNSSFQICMADRTGKIIPHSFLDNSGFCQKHYRNDLKTGYIDASRHHLHYPRPGPSVKRLFVFKFL